MCAGARGRVDPEILQYMFQKSLKMESAKFVSVVYVISVQREPYSLLGAVNTS